MRWAGSHKQQAPGFYLVKISPGQAVVFMAVTRRLQRHCSRLSFSLLEGLARRTYA